MLSLVKYFLLQFLFLFEYLLFFREVALPYNWNSVSASAAHREEVYILLGFWFNVRELFSWLGLIQTLIDFLAFLWKVRWVGFVETVVQDCFLYLWVVFYHPLINFLLYSLLFLLLFLLELIFLDNFTCFNIFIPSFEDF